MFKQRQKHNNDLNSPLIVTVASTLRSLLAARQLHHSALTSCLSLKQSVRKWGLLAVRLGIMTPVFPAEGGGGG